MKTISVNPFDCRLWRLHDRLETQITEESCRDVIESFSVHGQIVPVLGRAITNDPEYKVELIYGARRLFVAKHLNRSLTVEVRQMSDREAIIAMDIENRHRIDISPYERGRSYARMLQNKHFDSQEDIARSLGISASQVSRLLKVAQIPALIVEAFGDPAKICEGWGLELMEMLENVETRQQTIQVARELCRQECQLSARKVYERLLMASVRGRKVKRPNHDEVIKGQNGAPLFRIRHHNTQIAVLLPTNKLSQEKLTRVRNVISDILAGC